MEAHDPLPGLEGLLPLQVSAEGSFSRRRRPIDPNLRPGAETVAAFWQQVVCTPDCWYWTGAISKPDGYGRIGWESQGRQRVVSTHRFALELAHGPLSDGAVGEHKCNEPLCVRVAPGRLHGNIPLRADARSRYERSVDIRAALQNGYDPQRLEAAKRGDDPTAPPLF
jgi:hypothetical protein